MGAPRVPEVLYDSETVLRLVDSELEELRDEPAQARVVRLSEVVQQANEELGRVLATLRDSRQALHVASVQQIHASTQKLREVSCATELAATSIMDGLDRAHGLVDELDRLDTSVADAQAADVRGRLREELFGMMGPLQFQDITAQQLEHVSSMLAEVEGRLLSIATLLDCRRGGVDGGAEPAPQAGTEGHEIEHRSVPGGAFAESASTRAAVERQAHADALFRAQRAAARFGG